MRKIIDFIAIEVFLILIRAFVFSMKVARNVSRFVKPRKFLSQQHFIDMDI